MYKLIIDETTNTLTKFQTDMYRQHYKYVVIPHQYEGKQIDAIASHCFYNANIELLCTEGGVKRLEDSVDNISKRHYLIENLLI